MRRTPSIWILICLLALAAPAARAQEAPAQEAAAQEAPEGTTPLSLTEADPQSLLELLEIVKKGLEVEREENRRRVEAFRNARDQQAELLEEAKATLERKEAQSQEYEKVYNVNETAIGERGARLTDRLGELGELFGVVRMVATDTSGQVWDSLTTAELGDRKDLLDRLGRSKELPTTQDLERLWYELQLEMTAQGQVVRFRAPVLTAQGVVEEREVVRAGPFSAVSRGRYLLWDPTFAKLAEMTRQPPSAYVNTITPFLEAREGFAALAVDPSRGQLLNALTETPDRLERIQQGGVVGYVIITLGLFAGLLGLIRWVIVFFTSRRVAAQQKRDELDPRNPLGRVLSIFEENRQANAETLELKLDEAVMRESSKLQRLMWLVKTVSVLAPLLGLLGTVTGMIQTFQMITLFGAGDPKMMAGGISEALVTTMLGLTTAIPLVLLYDTLANMTKRVIDVLDEQSAGLIAARSERDNAGL